MHNVQIVIADREYAAELDALLVRDGRHRVYRDSEPDFGRDGVIVMDLAHFEKLACEVHRLDQIVLMVPRDEQCLRRAWDAGLQSVVYNDEPPRTLLLAVMAAELRHMPSDDSPSLRNERRRSMS